MITVHIIDNDAGYREFIKGEINDVADLTCIGEFGSCEEALTRPSDISPNIILLDIELGKNKISGIEGVRLLREKHPGSEVIMLTIHNDNEHVFNALQNGASGYLIKNALAEDLAASIREAHNGGSPMSMGIARMVVMSFRRNPPLYPLSEREKEVLDLLCEGASYNTIAEKLFICKTTVKFHIHNIYHILQVNNRYQAILKVRGKQYL
jgi:DNA-binding NarL/FixJ family response regulator